jgi:16S rRNA processing protein RimM
LLTDRELVCIGKLTRPHGLRGEMRVFEGQGTSGAWRQALELWIGPDEESLEAFQVEKIRGGGKFAILALSEVAGMDEAEALRGQLVFVDRNCLPPNEEGEFFAAELIGIRVEDRSGRPLGVLREIFDNGAHEVYVVVGDESEILLPVIEGVVLSVDLDGDLIVVDPPSGLPGLD